MLNLSLFVARSASVRVVRNRPNHYPTEVILNTNTTRNGAIAILAMMGTLAFSGCSQKPTSEEIAAQVKAAMSEEKAQEQAAAPAPAPAPVAKHVERKHVEKRTHVAETTPPPAMYPPPPPQRILCDACGVVASVKEIEQEGKGSGLGVVAGGLAGGLLGNQVGNGTGRDLATIAGALGGAFAGNTVEKKIKKTTEYDVTVEMDNGEKRVLRYKTAPGFMAGDKVKFEGDKIVRQ
jgi:outer membrane lipoprotein SlyB